MLTLSNNQIASESLVMLQTRLPPGWTVQLVASRTAESGDIELVGPDGRRVSFDTRIRASLDPRGVILLSAAVKDAGKAGGRTAGAAAGRIAGLAARRPVLVLCRYIAPSTRQKLVEADINYADLTGNVRITVSSPAIFLDARGADRCPFREERIARSLKGPKVGRVVRALVDFRETPGVRELAALAGVDAGYLSRLLTMFENEALVDRGPRGRVSNVDWAGLLRRWAGDAPLESRGQAVTCIDPRGIASIVGRLAASGLRYAVTGSLAAAKFAPVAPPRLAVIYVDDIEGAMSALGLRAADSGANVLLIRPADDVVFDRVSVVDGISHAAPAQVAADLLTSPGRGPAEAEELLSWMKTHEDTWRGRSNEPVCPCPPGPA